MDDAGFDENPTLKKRKRKKSYSNYVKKQGCHFTETEDVQLLECVKLYGEQWSRISKLLFKSMVKCHKRYKQLTGAGNEHAQKLSWTAVEDEILTKQVAIWGTKNWKKVSESLPNRIHKQCRERWVNILCPAVVKKKWTLEEDQQILRLYY